VGNALQHRRSTQSLVMVYKTEHKHCITVLKIVRYVARGFSPDWWLGSDKGTRGMGSERPKASARFSAGDEPVSCRLSLRRWYRSP
jgi:hypothetical protein